MRMCRTTILNLSVFYIVSLISSTLAEFNNFNPSGQLGLSDCISAQTQGNLNCSFSFNGSFAYDRTMVPMVIQQAGIPKNESPPYAVLYDLNPSASIGITDFLDVSLLQPFYFDVLGGGLPSGGTGDLHCDLKFRLPVGSRTAKFLTAVFIDGAIPLFKSDQGYFMRHTYFMKNKKKAILERPAGMFSSGKPSFTTMAIGSFNSKNIHAHLNIGYWWPLHSQLSPAIKSAVGFEVFKDEWLSVFTDLSMEPRLINVFDSIAVLDDPFHVTPGLSIRAPGGALFSCGCSFSITSGKIYSYINKNENVLLHAQAEPKWNAFIQLGWNGSFTKNDRDSDGLASKEDKCPDIPEDFDNYMDYDGCPDIDNDLDKIPDERDSCKNIPEDLDGYDDLNGCPDLDNDFDAVSDSIDRCPEKTEDRDGFEDSDGCPDSDNDADQILDSLDKCVLAAEDLDGFEDTDGCPDVDNDNDGVLDSLDKCPDTSGVASSQGCQEERQKSKEIKKGRLILPGVHFELGTSTLTVGSIPELDRLLYSLIDWPEVTIEVQAHTDNSLMPTRSQRLSQSQAEAVINYLIEKGVSASRLIAKGNGLRSPIADNRTVQGKALNNRIEIHRIDR